MSAFRFQMARLKGGGIHATMNKDILQCSAVLMAESRQLHIVCATFEELPAPHGPGSGADLPLIFSH